MHKKVIISALMLLLANPSFAESMVIRQPEKPAQKQIDLSGRSTSYAPTGNYAPVIEPNTSLFGAVLRRTTPIGALISSSPSRDIKTEKELGGFNFIAHLKPDMLPYAADFALNSSTEEMLETELSIRKEIQDETLIAKHPFKSSLISLAFNSPFLVLAFIIIQSVVRNRSVRNKIIR